MAQVSEGGVTERVSGAEDRGDERDEVDGEPEDGDTRPVGNGMAEWGMAPECIWTPALGESTGDEAMEGCSFVRADPCGGDNMGRVSVGLQKRYSLK